MNRETGHINEFSNRYGKYCIVGVYFEIIVNSLNIYIKRIMLP